MKWIIVANSSDCKIFEYQKNIHTLTLREEIKHPENRLREHDLIADSYGFYKKAGMHRSSYEPENPHTKQALDRFARELASKLNTGRIKHLFDNVILLMPSRMAGLLYKHLNKNVICMIKKMFKRNIINLSEHELKKYLCNNLQPAKIMH